MTRGKPLSLLVRFALPLMLGNIFQQLYTVVDTAIVGRGVGMDALAALGTVDWLNWMMLGLATGLCQGFGVRVSQKYGEGDLPGMRQAIGQSALLSAMVALLGVVVSQLGLPLFLRILRVPEALSGMATLYIRILFAGFPVMMFFNLCSSVLRAVGDSKTPLLAMVAASITNIALDALAVFVLGWGIGGAAAATVFAQCLAGTICFLRIWRSPILRFTREDTRFHRARSLDLVRIGLPIGGKNVILSLGGIGLQSIVNGFGTAFIAGYTATNKLYGVLEIAATSYGYALITFAGQNLGAGKLERIRQGTKCAVWVSLATSAVIGSVMIIFGRDIVASFLSGTPDEVEAATKAAYTYLAIMSGCLPVLYILHVTRSAVQGMGNTVLPMVSGIAEFVMRTGGVLLLPALMGENGIFVAEVMAWAGADLILIPSYFIVLRKHLQNRSHT